MSTDDNPLDIPYVLRINGSGVRAFIDPMDEDSPDWEHEPAHDNVSALCPYFWPGHGVHWIQARKGLATQSTPVCVLDVDGLDVSVELAGSRETWRLHDTSLLTVALLEFGSVTAHLHDHGLLRLGHRLLYPCRNLADWRSCPTVPERSAAPREGNWAHRRRGD